MFSNPLCVDYATELWFPPSFDEGPTGTDSEYFEIGKMVCSVCTHQTECRKKGEDEKYGLWGGSTPAERRKGSTRPPKRVMNEDAMDLLPYKFDTEGVPTSVDVPSLRSSIQSVTRKRQPAS
jgi:hypothetical protein